MFKGFYNLTSAMLTQGKNLNVISNNMTNVTTAGYKADQFTASTFDEVLISRVGNKDKSGAQEIGTESYILAPSELYTDFSSGTLQETGIPLDFAINGEGFFGVETADGIAYTRNGSFSLDDEGYLVLPGAGRILSSGSQPIWLGTDDLSADGSGRLFSGEGTPLGQIGVFDFDNLEDMAHSAQGLFTTGEAPASVTGAVLQKRLETSNVNLMQQMVDMMSAQRAYQSAAQMSKMYDRVMSQITTEIGRL